MKGVHTSLLTKTQDKMLKHISSLMYFGMLLARDVKECTCAISNVHFIPHFSQHIAGENIHSHTHTQSGI